MKHLMLKILCAVLILAALNTAALAELMPVPRAAIPQSDTALTLTASSDWKSKVKALDWYHGGSKVLKKGGYGYLYDVRSGIYFKIKRMGGSAHADCEPATRSDTAKMKKIGYSYSRRPGILYANGKFVAVSFTTQPHGDQTITSNGYNGQFCLHMVNSKTHGSDRVDEDHQSAVKKAYYWAH